MARRAFVFQAEDKNLDTPLGFWTTKHLASSEEKALEKPDEETGWRIAIFGSIASIACRSPRLVLTAALTLTLLSWIPPLKIGMRYTADIGSMLPPDVPAARAFSAAVVDFDSADEAVIVFRLDGTRQSIRCAGIIADRIVARLRGDADIRNAFCRKYTAEERDFLLREEMPKRGLLFLSDENCQEIAKRLQPAKIRAAEFARAAAKSCKRIGGTFMPAYRGELGSVRPNTLIPTVVPSSMH
ncbi:MAG: hypothetical protein N3A66_09180, partial [Planctomycetota bacterium]|nr:hypothetical protein [Planctomycetota bacterium]